MPLLEHLELKAFKNAPDLPPLPVQPPLHTFHLIIVPALSGEQLVCLGYTRVPALTLSRADDLRHLIDALAQLTGSQSALCVSTDCNDIALELGRTVRFAVQPQHNRVLQQLLCAHESAFHSARTLRLPASLIISLLRFLIYPAVLLEPNAVAHQPALDTIVLECAGQRARGDCVPFLKFLGGMIHAPALARILIIAAPEAGEYRVVERIEVSHLVSLVGNTLVCDGKSSLELIVDTANGVELNGNLDELRSRVGNVII